MSAPTLLATAGGQPALRNPKKPSGDEDTDDEEALAPKERNGDEVEESEEGKTPTALVQDEFAKAAEICGGESPRHLDAIRKYCAMKESGNAARTGGNLAASKDDSRFARTP